jgi:hypothetical protein
MEWANEMSRFSVKWIASVVKGLSVTDQKWDELPTKLTDNLLHPVPCISGPYMWKRVSLAVGGVFLSSQKVL